MKEIWKTIPFRRIWEVSNHGRVRSSYKNPEDALLKPSISTSGYLQVSYTARGRQISRTIHSLVAEMFLGKKPKGMQVCHNDGNPLNNRLSNLRYDTCKGNHADRVDHKTSSQGSRNGRSKLTESDVVDIFRLRARKLMHSDIASLKGVSSVTVSHILNKNTWKHVKERA